MTADSIIAALRRFWWLVIGFAVAAFVAGALPAPAKSADVTVTRHIATRSLLVESDSGNLFNDPVALSQIELLVKKGVVPERAAERLGIDVSEGARIGAGLSTVLNPSTAELQVTTEQSSSDMAFNVIEAFTEELVIYIPERQDQLRETRAASTLERLTTLEDEIDKLQGELADDPDNRVIAAQLDARTRQYTLVFETYDNLSFDNSVLTVAPLTSTSVQTVTENAGGLQAPRGRWSRGALAAILGAALGVLVAWALTRSDRRVRTIEGIEQALGMTVSALIPEVDSPPSRVVVSHDRHDQLSDAYRTLRSVLLFSNGANRATSSKRTGVTVVVSACPGDGKTSVAANLAASLAESGRRTVAVNTDFRRPALSQRIVGEPLSSLASDVEGLMSLSTPALLVRTGIPLLAMFDIAGIGSSPGELTRATARRIESMLEVADSVVIDTSPVGSTAEVLELLPHADAIVIVTRLDHTLTDAAVQAMSIIRRLSDAPTVLAVIGDVSARSPYYEYAGRVEAPRRLRRRNSSPGPSRPSAVERDELVPSVGD